MTCEEIKATVFQRLEAEGGNFANSFTSAERACFIKHFSSCPSCKKWLKDKAEIERKRLCIESEGQREFFRHAVDQYVAEVRAKDQKDPEARW